MRSYWLMVPVLFCGLAAGASSGTGGGLWLPSSAFSFEVAAFSPNASALPASVAESLPDTAECECRARCLSDPTCRGFGYSDATSSCQLASVLPTEDRMEASPDTWTWHLRRAVRELGEPCAGDDDCSLMTLGATCVGGVCACRPPLEEDGAGGCRKTGQFVSVGRGQLTSEPLFDAPAASPDDCETTCAANLTCVAFDFSAAEGRCTFFAAGVSSDAGSGRDAESFEWRFPRPDGTPPATYQDVNGTYLWLTAPTTGRYANSVCLADGGIPFPGVRRAQLQTEPLAAFVAALPSGVLVGLNDMTEEGRFVTTDGDDNPDVPWVLGEPNNLNGIQHCAQLQNTGLVNDVWCGHGALALCQHEGENLALGKLSWLNVAATHPASFGNDGDTATDTATAPPGALTPPTLTWTVDLGGPAQVTGVVFVGRDDCCPADNVFTEVRVGSDPARFDDARSARCFQRDQLSVGIASARLFRCQRPITGRYVRVIRDARRSPNLVFSELAVIGNRLVLPRQGPTEP